MLRWSRTLLVARRAGVRMPAMPTLQARLQSTISSEAVNEPRMTEPSPRRAPRPYINRDQVDKFKELIDSGDIHGAARKVLGDLNGDNTSLYRQPLNALFTKLRAEEKSALGAALPPGEGQLPLTKQLLLKLLEYGPAPGWMASYVTMYDVARGAADEGIETWIKFLESIGNPDVAGAQVNREAAWAALVAYIVSSINAGAGVDADIARQLVPLKKFPGKAAITRLELFTMLPEELAEKVISSLDDIRLHHLDFNDLEFLKDLSGERPMELVNKFNEAKLKSAKTGEKFSEATYSRFIASFSEATQVTQAFDIWNEMIKNGIKPTILAWNSLLKAAALSRTDKHAVTSLVWDQMVESGVKPDSESYATLIDLHFRTFEPEKALELFNQVRDGKFENVSMTLKVFNVVINGMLKNNMIAEAEGLLKEGQDVGLTGNMMTYNSFIRTYIQKQEFKKTFALLEEMNELGIDPDVVTYTNIIDATFKNAVVNGTSPTRYIEDLIEEMAAKGIKANTVAMTSIISGLVKTSRDIDAARLVFDSILRKRLTPNARTFAAIIDGELQLGSIEQAQHYFGLMRQFGLRRTTPIYNQFINWLSRKGDANGALEMLKQLTKDRHTDPNYFSYYFALNVAMRTDNRKVSQQIVDMMGARVRPFPLGEALPKQLLKLESQGVTVPPHIIQLARKDEE